MANSIMIFGSGHLIEIPIEQIFAKFEKFVLVDLVHPKSVKKLAVSAKNYFMIRRFKFYFEVSKISLLKNRFIFFS